MVGVLVLVAVWDDFCGWMEMMEDQKLSEGEYQS